MEADLPFEDPPQNGSGQTIEEKVERYCYLKRTIPELENERKELSREIITYFEDRGTKNMRLQSGAGVGMQLTTRWRLNKDDRPDGLSALREMGLGDIIKSEESVDANTLSAQLKAYEEQGNPVPAPFKKSTVPSLSLLKKET
jgi:hypothetical protein